MLTLGISGLYHDSAAALCMDGMIIAAAQEERFTRIKHDLNIPYHAIDYCMKEAGSSVKNLDCVVYYDNPFLTLDRSLKNVIALGKEGKQFAERNLSSLLHNKIWIEDHLRKRYGKIGEEPLYKSG